MEKTNLVTFGASSSVLALGANSARKGYKVINDISPAVAVSVRPYKAVDTADTNEVQRITFSQTPGAGSFKLGFGKYFTSALAFDASAATIQTALRLLPGLAAVTVARTTTGPIDVTFVGIYPAPSLVVAESTLKTAGTSDVQTVTFSASPISGTFKLKFRLKDFGGFVRELETGSLVYSLNAAGLQAYLRGFLSDNALTVSGSFSGGFVITFGDKREHYISEVKENSLFGGGVAQVTTIKASIPVFQGQFKLQINGEKTAFLNFGAQATTEGIGPSVQKAIRDLGAKYAGVTVAPIDGGSDNMSGGHTITFTGVEGPVTVVATDNTLANFDSDPADVDVVTVTPGVANALLTSTVAHTTKGVDQAEVKGLGSVTTPGTSINAATSVAASATLDQSNSGMTGPLYLRAAAGGQVKIVEVF